MLLEEIEWVKHCSSNVISSLDKFIASSTSGLIILTVCLHHQLELNVLLDCYSYQ